LVQYQHGGGVGLETRAVSTSGCLPSVVGAHVAEPQARGTTEIARQHDKSVDSTERGLLLPRRATLDMMYIYPVHPERAMTKKYSVAEARGQLPRLLHAVEAGEQVEITRRGKSVAVVISMEDYKRLAGPTKSFAEAYKSWRQSVSDEDLDLDPGYWDSLRDRSPGRDVKLWD